MKHIHLHIMRRITARHKLVSGLALGTAVCVVAGFVGMPTTRVAASEKLQQIVIVPITGTVADPDAPDQAATATPVRWRSPAGSLLPDDFVDPPEAQPTQIAAITETQPAPEDQATAQPDPEPIPIQTAAQTAVMIAPKQQPPTATSPALWEKYAVPVSEQISHSDRPKIAIIIDDVGLNQSRAWRLFRMPGPLTVSFLPYAERLSEMAAAARSQGHELMLHMPMEPFGQQDPGPGALRTGYDAHENLDRLEQALARFSGFVGVNNHMGSRFTSTEAAISPILHRIQEHGLLFVDSATSPKSVAADIADQIGLPHASRDVFLDDDMSLEAVRKSLGLVEQTARRRGMAIAIGHPHPNTMALLEEWLPRARQRGFEIVPVSWIVKAREKGKTPQQVAAAP